jgi:hypothetical protein
MATVQLHGPWHVWTVADHYGGPGVYHSVCECDYIAPGFTEIEFFARDQVHRVCAFTTPMEGNHHQVVPGRQGADQAGCRVRIQ